MIKIDPTMTPVMVNKEFLKNAQKVYASFT